MPNLYKDGERPFWHIYHVFRSIDMFGQQVPSFNLKGQGFVNTVLGGVCTGVIILIVMLFATFKIRMLINKENPVMSELLIPDYYGVDDELYYNDIDFKVAFSVEGYWDEEMKADKRYIKWMARNWFTDEFG